VGKGKGVLFEGVPQWIVSRRRLSFAVDEAGEEGPGEERAGWVGSRKRPRRVGSPAQGVKTSPLCPRLSISWGKNQ